MQHTKFQGNQPCGSGNRRYFMVFTTYGQGCHFGHVTNVLDLCDERRDLKTWYEAEGAKEYGETNRRIQKAVKKAKEDWIGAQWEEIETCLNKNNSKRAYQLVKDLPQRKNFPG